MSADNGGYPPNEWTDISREARTHNIPAIVFRWICRLTCISCFKNNESTVLLTAIGVHIYCDADQLALLLGLIILQKLCIESARMHKNWIHQISLL